MHIEVTVFVNFLHCFDIRLVLLNKDGIADLQVVPHLQVGESVEEIDRRVPPVVKEAPTLARSAAKEVRQAGLVGTATSLAKSAIARAFSHQGCPPHGRAALSQVQFSGA